MNVLGLDLSLTGTGVCYNGALSTITTKEKDELRINFIHDAIFMHDMDLVVVEGLAYGTQTGKAMERAGLWWHIKMRLWEDDIPVSVVPPTNLKRFICGKGNASKDEMVIATVRLFPEIEFKNNNESDALGLYAMLKDRLGDPIVSLPAKNREALEKVNWNLGWYGTES